jgi:hypothetical protein
VVVTVDEDRITADDVAALNRASLARVATIGRYAAIVLLVVAAFGFAAWVWVVARQQNLFGGGDGFLFGGDRENPSFTERVDLFATSISILVSAGMVGALGLGLRLVSDFILMRAGATLTGVEVGDEVEETPAEDLSDDQDWAP